MFKTRIVKCESDETLDLKEIVNLNKPNADIATELVHVRSVSSPNLPLPIQNFILTDLILFVCILKSAARCFRYPNNLQLPIQ